MTQAAASKYLSFLSRMSAGSVGELATYCAPDVHFRDPFHDVIGVDRYVAVCAAMFEAMHVDAFEVATTHLGETCCFEWILRYRFRGRLLANAAGSIPGASVVRFNASGLVAAQVDYWDAGVLYARMPLLGPLVRAVRKRVAGPATA